MSLIPGSGRWPGGENGMPPVFLPEEFHGQRSLVGYSPWGQKEPDVTEHSIYTYMCINICRSIHIFIYAKEIKSRGKEYT